MGTPEYEILKWQLPSPVALPDPGIELTSPALAGRFFTTEPPGKPKTVQHKEAAEANEKESHSLLGSP